MEKHSSKVTSKKKSLGSKNDNTPTRSQDSSDENDDTLNSIENLSINGDKEESLRLYHINFRIDTNSYCIEFILIYIEFCDIKYKYY